MLHPVTVELGGQTRTLRCDLGAWAAVEDYGTKLPTVLAALSNGGLSFKQVQVLVTAMLWREKATLEQVGEWVSGENFPTVMAQVGEALRSAFPEDATGPPRDAPTGTGSPSSSSGPTAD